MKRIITLISVAVCGVVFIQSAQAALTLPFYDSIPSTYTEGGQLGAAGVGETSWTAGGTPGVELTVAAANALSYPGLQTPPADSRGILYADDVATRYRGINFTAVSSGKVYCSFLMRVIPSASLASGNRVIASLHSSTTGTSTPECAIIMQKISGSSGYIGLGKHASTPISTNGVSLGTVTNLVVVRYTFVDGATNNTMDLWLNPGSLGVSEANVPVATLADLADASQPDASSLNTFFLQVGTTAAAGIAFDEIRIGTNWAEVTPAAGAPATPALKINTSQLVGDQLTLTGSGGTNSAAYIVLTAPDLTTPMGSWLTWTNGNFDGSGNFSVTGTIPGGTHSCFRIQE